MSGLLDNINTGYTDIITDADIEKFVENIFNMNINNKKDEMIKFECYFGTIHLNKKII